MSRGLRSKDEEDNSSTISLSKNYVTSRNQKATENTLSASHGEYLRKVQYFQLDNLTFCFQESGFTACEPVTIWLDTPSIQMNFVLEGERLYKPVSGYGPSCQLLSGQHSLGYYTAMNGELWYGEGVNCVTIDLWFPETYLRTVFQNDLAPLGNLGKAIEKAQSALIGNRSFPLTESQRNILLAMSNCLLDGQLKKMFLEGKLLELLALQVAQFQADADAPKQTSLTREDIDKLEFVKEALLKAIDQPPSIKELAMLVGLNRTKLMGGFKELFGTTIYGYLADFRMERAKELMLTDKYIKVAEVARLVGFKSPNNFSVAFKKKFGYSPNAIR